MYSFSVVLSFSKYDCSMKCWYTQAPIVYKQRHCPFISCVLKRVYNWYNILYILEVVDTLEYSMCIDQKSTERGN